MASLPQGIYEALLDEELSSLLQGHPELRSVFGKLDPEEEPARYAAFVARLLEKALRLETDPAIHHQAWGYTMLFCARSRKKVEGLTSPFTFLGPAELVRYESERPIQMVWRLAHPMPAEPFEENRRGG